MVDPLRRCPATCIWIKRLGRKTPASTPARSRHCKLKVSSRNCCATSKSSTASSFYLGVSVVMQRNHSAKR
jgi:hypothetical protein